jgi:hypothetical protein
MVIPQEGGFRKLAKAALSAEAHDARGGIKETQVIRVPVYDPVAEPFGRQLVQEGNGDVHSIDESLATVVKIVA